MPADLLADSGFQCCGSNYVLEHSPGAREDLFRHCESWQISNCAVRCTGVRFRQLFREDPTGTVLRDTTKFTRLEQDINRNTLPGQVGNRTPISAMHLGGYTAAARALRERAACTPFHLDRPRNMPKADQLHFRSVWDQRSWFHRTGAEIARAVYVLSHPEALHQKCARTQIMSNNRRPRKLPLAQTPAAGERRKRTHRFPSRLYKHLDLRR